MKLKFISIKRLKMHEMDTTIRVFGEKENNWTKKSEIFSTIQDKATKTFLAVSGQLLAAYLIATSLRSGSSITLKLSNFEASVPAA